MNIDLCDEIEISSAKDISLQVSGNHTVLEDDLILQVARQLKNDSGYDGGAKIHLKKKIPVSAGLGGGSSDAAAVLRGLNKLWGLGWAKDQLIESAVSVSSDAAFFFYGGTALAEGRGEVITSLPDIDPLDLVLLVPPLKLKEKTKRMYKSLQDSDFGLGLLTDQLLDKYLRERVLDTNMLVNAFQSGAFKMWPELEGYRNLFMKYGASKVYLAGSGPVMFAFLSPSFDIDRRAEIMPELPSPLLIKARTISSSETLKAE